MQVLKTTASSKASMIQPTEMRKRDMDPSPSKLNNLHQAALPDCIWQTNSELLLRWYFKASPWCLKTWNICRSQKVWGYRTWPQVSSTGFQRNTPHKENFQFCHLEEPRPNSRHCLLSSQVDNSQVNNIHTAVVFWWMWSCSPSPVDQPPVPKKPLQK